MHTPDAQLAPILLLRPQRPRRALGAGRCFTAPSGAVALRDVNELV
jgi:hypothetical protein